MVSIVVTGWVLDQFTGVDVQTIVIGTGIVSLIPLVAWSLAIPWIERKAMIERTLEGT